MWILPVDLSALRIELASGPHLLPSHYTDTEIDRLSWLLRATLAGVHSEVRLDLATLGSLVKRKVTVPDALVVVRLRELPASLDEMTERVKGLGARCALIQLPEPQEVGYGWLEREVKAPLYRALGAWLKQPAHPLSVFHPDALPVLEAAGLTTDPVELLDLLERCLAHRVRYADIGCDEAAYRRSLLLNAGERLAERLGGLEEQALQAALEVLLWEGRGPGSRERFVAGSAALVKVGLATHVAGDLRLGPLPRSVLEREVLGALESSLRQNAWTDESRRLARELRERGRPPEERASVAIGTTLPSMGGAAGTVDVSLPMDEIHGLMEEVFPGDPAIAEAVSLVRELARQPGFVSMLDTTLQARLVQALRALETSAGSAIPKQREAGRLLSGLLRLLAARGVEAVDKQEEALRDILEALDDLNPAWAGDLRLVALFWNATARIRWLRRVGDLGAAEAILEECLAAWTTEERRIAAHLALGEIASYREDHARSREHREEALRLARAGVDPSEEAAVQLALAQVALEESRSAEAELWGKRALTFYELAGDKRAAARARNVLGSVFTMQERYKEARPLLAGAQATMAELGDVAGQIDSALRLALVLWHMDEVRKAESLTKETLATAERVGLPVPVATALYLQVLFLMARGELDEALEACERASGLLQGAGVHRETAAEMLELVRSLRSPNHRTG